MARPRVEIVVSGTRFDLSNQFVEEVFQVLMDGLAAYCVCDPIEESAVLEAFGSSIYDTITNVAKLDDLLRDIVTAKLGRSSEVSRG